MVRRLRLSLSRSGGTLIRDGGAVLALALCYVAAGWLGLRMDAVSQFASLVWAPTGIALAALVRLGFRAWPGVWLGALAVNLLRGAPVPMACGIATGNTLEAVLGAALLLRIPGFTPALARVSHVLGLVILGAGFSTTASATIGTLSLYYSGRLSASFAETWRTWWVGDLIGDLVIAPLLLTLPTSFRWPQSPRRVAEALLLTLALCGGGVYVFFGGGLLGHAGTFQQPVMTWPLLIWAALRFGVRGAAWASFGTAVLAIWGTAAACQALQADCLHIVLGHLEAFMAVAAGTFLVLSAAAEERTRALAQERLARQEATEAQQKLALLVDTSTVLASSREFRSMAQQLTQLVVARLGNACGCTLDLLAEDGTLHRYATRAADPEKALLLEAGTSFALRPGSANPVLRAYQTGRSVLVREVDDAVLDALAESPAQRAVLAQLELRSLMITPLSTGGRVLGVLTVPSMQKGRCYDEEDLAFLEQLAQRSAVLFNSAMQYQAVEHNLRAQEDALAMMAHDLRNPLGTIQTSAQLLERLPSAEIEPIQKMAATIRAASARMARLLTEQLEVAFLSAGALHIQGKPCAARELLSECVLLYSPLAREKRVTLASAPTAPELYALGDRDRLLQVLDNLVGNALKFTPAGGQIDLRAELAQGMLVFSVADNGPGIPEALLPRLFERYGKADSVAGRGVGLGLYIARAIVDAHKGRIWVESSAQTGTTFYFAVPVADRPAQSSL